MRVGRLLRNDPPPPTKPGKGALDGLVEHAIQGGDATVKIDRCVVRSIVAQHQNAPEKGMQFARLEAVFRLKATGIVESVLEFSLGPLVGNTLHVTFRGQRPRRYQNVDPEVITIDGECRLDG